MDSRIANYRAAHPELDGFTDDEVINAVGKLEAPGVDPQEYKSAFMKVYGSPEPEKGVLSTMASGLVAGVGDVASSTGGAIDFLSGGNSKNPLTKWGTDLSNENAPPPEAQANVLDNPEVLGKWQWWAHNVPRMMPFIASSFIPGGVGFKAGTAAAKVMGAGEGIMHIAGVVGAAGAGGLYESLGEAGSAYNQMIDQGKSKEEANAAATSVLAQNVVLNSLTNAIEIGKVFKLKGVIPTEDLVKKTIKQMMSDIGVTTVTEATQEALQQVISNTATGQNWYDGLAESAILGGVGGGVYGGGLDMIYNMGKPTRERLEQKLASEQGTDKAMSGTIVDDTELDKTVKAAQMKKAAGTMVENMKKAVKDIQDPETLDKTIEQFEDSIIRTDKDPARAKEVLTSLAQWYGGDKVRYAESLAEAIGGYMEESIDKQKANKKANEKAPKTPAAKVNKDAGVGEEEATTTDPKKKSTKKEEPVVKSAIDYEKGRNGGNWVPPPQDIVPQKLRDKVVYTGNQSGVGERFTFWDGSGKAYDGMSFSYITGEGNPESAMLTQLAKFAPAGIQGDAFAKSFLQSVPYVKSDEGKLFYGLTSHADPEGMPPDTKIVDSGWLVNGEMKSSAELTRIKNERLAKEKAAKENFATLPAKEKRKAVQKLFNLNDEQMSALADGMIPAVAKTRGVTPEELVWDKMAGVEKSVNNKDVIADSRAAIEFVDNNMFILHSITNPDFTSVVHELIPHVVSKYWLTPEETVHLQSIYGENWASGFEDISVGFEKYMLEGKSPKPELQPLFEKMKKFFIDVYQNIKDYFSEDAINPKLREVFDSWLSEESKQSLEHQVRSEITKGIPLDKKRIIGSIENLSPEEAATSSDQLQRIGYKSKPLPTQDGKIELVYFVEANEKVQKALALRTRELTNDNLSLSDKWRLGRAFGYSDEAIKNYTNEIKKSQIDDKYFSGDIYSVPKGNTKDYWRLVDVAENGDVTLELLKGPTAKNISGEPLTISLSGDKFASGGFTKEERRVQKDSKQASGRSSEESTKERRDRLLAEMKSKKTADDYSDDWKKMVEEEFGGDIAAALEAANKSMDLAETIAEETDLNARGGKEYVAPNLEESPEDEQARTALRINDEQNTKLRKAHERLNYLESKFEIDMSEDEREKLVEDFNKTSKFIQDLESGVIPSGYYTTKERKSLYDELGLTDEQGKKINDDTLEKMHKNRLNGMIDGEIHYQASVSPLARSNGEQVAIQIEDAGKDVFDRFTPAGIKSQIEEYGLDKNERAIKRDKVFMMMGMMQTLARYNPEFFGEVFWAIDDSMKIASERNIKTIQREDYLAGKRLPVSSRIKVSKALIDGTLARTEAYYTKPEPPKFDTPMALLKITMNDEQLTAEAQRRRQIRASYKETVANWKSQQDEEYRSRGREWTSEELRQKYNMNEDEVKFYKTVRAISNESTTYWKLSSLAGGMPKDLAEQIYSLKGYVPLERGSGKWGMFFKDPSSPKGIGYARFETKQEADHARTQLIQKGLVDESKDEHKVRRTLEVPREYYQYFGPSQLTALLDESGVKGKNRDSIMKEYRKKQYANARQIPRGYVGVLLDEKNFFSTFEQWVESTNRRYAKAITRQRVDAILSLNRDKAGNNRMSNAWKNFAQDYVNLAYSPDKYRSNFWDNVRRAGFLWALSFNVSNGLLNLTQPFVTTLPELMDKKYGLSAGEASNSFVKGAGIGVDAAFRNKLSAKALSDIPGLGEAYEKWKSQSVISASLYEQLVNVFGATNKLLHVAGIVQSKTERVNRVLATTSGYIAAYDHIIGKAKGNLELANHLANVASLSETEMREIAVNTTPGKQSDEYASRMKALQNRIFSGAITEDEKQYIAMKFGRNISDQTNFIYGKHTMPSFIQKSGVMANPLKSGFLFKGFMLNYVGFLGTLLQSNRITARQLSYAILPLVAIAGVSGLPFADDIKEALKKLGIFDTDTEVRRLIGDGTLADLTLKGIPSVLPGQLAFDMSRRAGAGQILPEGLPQGDVGKALQDFFIGAPLSMLNRASDGIKDIIAGDYTQGTQKATPVFISNIIKTIRYSDEGAMSSRGDLLVPSSKLRGAPQALQFFGFKPESVAGAEDMEAALRYLTQGRRDAVEEFNSKMATAIRKNDRGQLQDVIHEIMRYNARVKHYGDRYNLRDQMSGVRRRVLIGTQPTADVQKQVPSGLRGEAVKIQQLYNQ